MALKSNEENKLFLKIITPNGSFFEESVDYFSLKIAKGDITILPKKSPIISYIKPSKVKICIDKSKEKYVEAIIMDGIFSSLNSTSEIITKDIKWIKDVKVENINSMIEFWKKELNKYPDKSEYKHIEALDNFNRYNIILNIKMESMEEK